MMYEANDDIYTSTTNQQRMARHKRSPSDTSTPSHTLISAVQRFVSAVNGMNDTIMVPSRLLDMEMATNDSDKSVPDLLQSGQDPYVVYGLLNSTKNDLIYGLSSSEETESLKKERVTTSDRWSSNPSYDTASQTSSTSSSNSSNSKLHHQHSRKISDLSLMSLGSSSGSCDSSSSSTAESEVTEEAEDVDSCLSSEDSTASSVAQASSELRTHLSGLFSCLNQLADTAVYITDRYQEELGGDL